MPTETAPPSSKAEHERLLRREFFKRPWLGRCSFLTIGFLIGGLMLNYLPEEDVRLSTRYLMMSAAFFAGAIAGAAGFFTAPRPIRKFLPLLSGPALLNTTFFLVFAYQTIVRFLHHAP